MMRSGLFDFSLGIFVLYRAQKYLPEPIEAIIEIHLIKSETTQLNTSISEY